MSQIATSNAFVAPGRGGRRYLPYAFTERGAIIAATILNSSRAVKAKRYGGVSCAFISLAPRTEGQQLSSQEVSALCTRCSTWNCARRVACSSRSIKTARGGKAVRYSAT